MDRDLTFTERIFFRLPLAHSEDLTIHERIVRGAEEAATEDYWPAQLPRALQEFMLEQAKGARDVIACFGRYPHRNEVLGRTSTPEELEYLRTETPVHLRRPPQSSEASELCARELSNLPIAVCSADEPQHQGHANACAGGVLGK